ncbi:major facilitator superfamily domain-containing protein [Hortaea werneckii]|uniref:Molybdate-anion transporter n=1 Tax=Hortaea werneckii TaxID=91943 RepID=A0A3M7E5M1_HORWE|nr:major facilitator superfamily domain-containing protein [Hortaea werneckii]KAI7622398.1 major facilitator superfamily domain-containing protein [Hortaea werneckii]KAI7632760.1 major facilitator superfamily domain-containing protein [Hortaea werneckii]KAI7681180.1 major facilitator superfamily domain-containing protein [Hortaea werneckii]KAI7713350.1 major facilitator superfamily domain-containing protein [Hortaea werneckii]
MEIYAAYFTALTCFNLALFTRQHLLTHTKQSPPISPSEEEEEESISLANLPNSPDKQAVWDFKRIYFGVYILATAADWLQGPYIYTLYHDAKDLAEPTVAALFTTGFVAAAVSASFVGSLADRYGRKAACLGYCLTYTLSCVSVLSADLVVLFAGRALGGVSTTLLYSVFETWMVAEYHVRELGACGLRLGDMFSASVMLSGLTAIGSGVVGEALVKWTGSKSSPFLLAAVCLCVAFGGIWHFWVWDSNAIIVVQCVQSLTVMLQTENLAVPSSIHSFSPSIEEKDHQQQSSTPAQATYRDILRDKRLLTLTFTTTAFEGSMYLLVFFWSPALEAARASSASARGIPLENGGENVPGLPFGLIFASFMSAMMLGSMTTSAMNLTSNLKTSSRLTLHTVALAAIALVTPVLAKSSETGVFWAFALFEICVGMYFPAMSKLKSEVVEERVRGKVYGMMRVPLNLFVVLALGSTKEGEAYRDTMFRTAGSLLLIAFVVIARYLD